MNVLSRTALIVGVAMGASAHAQEIDGKSNLICAFSQWVECSANECVSVAPEEIKGVRFIGVDPKKKELSSRDAGDDRTAKISTIVDKDFQLAMQGMEYALAWTMTVDKSDGEMTFSGARENVVFNAFGYCAVD